MFLICFNFNVFIVYSSEIFIAFYFFKCCSLYLINFPGLYVPLCTSPCFHFFQGCSLFVCCWFLFMFHTYLTITVGILTFLFGHHFFFSSMFLNNMCFTISWVPSVVARFFGRCSREDLEGHNGSKSLSHGFSHEKHGGFP